MQPGKDQSLLLGVLCVGLGCGGGTKPDPELSLVPLNIYDINVIEPSGLTIDDNGTTLWTVAGKRIYQLALDGTVVKELDFKGVDLEGVAYDARTGTLWVVEEGLRQVINVTTDGTVINSQTLDLQGDPNSGLEGICLDSGDSLFAVNEKDPTLFLELDTDASIKERLSMPFVGDLSGLAYHPTEKCFWVLSDQERRIFLWSRTKGVVGSYLLGYRKAEGIAYDAAADLVYIVNDEQNKLYVYHIER